MREGWNLNMSSMSLPVVALVLIGILLAMLGLFAPQFPLVIVGLVAIAVGGVLQVMGSRRA
jgi:membrane protein implicated in regulation of membrane protease activity